jgi:hypothetical protein
MQFFEEVVMLQVLRIHSIGPTAPTENGVFIR